MPGDLQLEYRKYHQQIWGDEFHRYHKLIADELRDLQREYVHWAKLNLPDYLHDLKAEIWGGHGGAEMMARAPADAAGDAGVTSVRRSARVRRVHHSFRPAGHAKAALQVDCYDQLSHAVHYGWDMEAVVFNNLGAEIGRDQYNSDEGAQLQIGPDQLRHMAEEGDARIELWRTTAAGQYSEHFLTIKKSLIPGAGVGLFAATYIPACTFLAAYTGLSLPIDINGQGWHNPFYTYSDPEDDRRVIDPTEGLDPMKDGMYLYSGIQTVNAVDGAFAVRFSDNEKENVESGLFLDTDDKPHIRMYTSKPVLANEELLTTYHWAMNPADITDDSNYISTEYWVPGWYYFSASKEGLPVPEHLSLFTETDIRAELAKRIEGLRTADAIILETTVQADHKGNIPNAVLWWLATYWAIERLAYNNWLQFTEEGKLLAQKLKVRQMSSQKAHLMAARGGAQKKGFVDDRMKEALGQGAHPTGQTAANPNPAAGGAAQKKSYVDARIAKAMGRKTKAKRAAADTELHAAFQKLKF